VAQPYIGEIRMAGFNFAPIGFAPCDGRLLPISEYTALFALLGTTFGGDGQTTFGLPDLRGRIPLHWGAGFNLGQASGSETVTLTTAQIASHTHPAGAGGTAATTDPTGNLPGVVASGSERYAAAAAGPVVPLAGTAVGPSGGNQPHNNVMPSLVINYIIALEGVFPSQN
jgi:microcystin-dependent protein